jgi:hypothetical protein
MSGPNNGDCCLRFCLSFVPLVNKTSVLSFRRIQGWVYCDMYVSAHFGRPLEHRAGNGVGRETAGRVLPGGVSP